MSLPMYLELASYLTNDWSLSGELMADMGVTDEQIRSMVQNAKEKGINIDRHLGKLRLGIDTSIDQVRLAIETISNTKKR